MDRQLKIDRSWIIAQYGDKAKEVLREMQYYNLYGELPANGLYIEKIEWFGEDVLIIHRDTVVQQ